MSLVTRTRWWTSWSFKLWVMLLDWISLFVVACEAIPNAAAVAAALEREKVAKVSALRTGQLEAVLHPCRLSCRLLERHL